MSFYINPIFSDRQIERLIENHNNEAETIIAHLIADETTEMVFHAFDPVTGNLHCAVRDGIDPFERMVLSADSLMYGTYETVSAENTMVFYSIDHVIEQSSCELAEYRDTCLANSQELDWPSETAHGYAYSSLDLEF